MKNQLERIELEYMIKTSPGILFNRLSTPSGMSEWFADDVSINGKTFIFKWEGSEQSAEQTLKKNNQFVRYVWRDDEHPVGAWFEFQINVDELTQDVALMIIDNIEPDEKEDAIELWDSQIEVLKHGLGSG
ncbi:START-like domain-containing protein [Marinilabiliaceae bacterium ANBcel2]|nr:START-like domain-containing protein [Marinilabiliaceae bacterium ANBcel2]